MHVPQTEIILRYDGDELARVELAPGEYIIGRSAEAGICAETPLLSRQHARLTIHLDHLLIEDLGSSNGTFVNDQRISESTRLFPNQHIRLGDVTVEVRRQRAPSEPGTILAPAQATIRRLLPDELLAHKRYAIGAIVAQGGMGAILSASQSAMKRGVAMKVMLANQNEGDVLRFIEEAQITGQLEHPNIVPVHELGVDENDQLYYTMKMVRGITLKKVLDLLADGLEGTVKKYPLAALLTIFQKSCDAVAFAHSKGVLHRDLKPENLMIGDFGEVLVMDWGLAKIIGQDEAAPAADSLRTMVHSARSAEGQLGSTLAGTIMGTPQYMSPEQALGEVELLDARSDLYALGAILFHLIYLRPPVGDGEAMSIVRKVAQGVVEWPDGKEAAKRFAHLPDGHAPQSLIAVCRKALALQPGQRYASVEEFQLDLTAYQTGFATSAEHVTAWKQFRFFIRRNRATSTAVAAALVIIAAVTGIFTFNVVRERNRAEGMLHELRGTAPTFAAQARALVEAGDLQEALNKIIYATQLDPQNADHHLQHANYLQVALRLREAGAAYRQVLALRPGDAAAQKNLALSDRLLATNHGHEDLPKPLLIELVNALLAEGRTIEANPLAQRVGQGTAATETALRARLKSLTAQPGWNSGRIRLLPNGTVDLNLNDLRISDLSLLSGFPIGRLAVNDPNVRDISPLAGLPISNLGLGGTNVTDLSPVAGMPLELIYLNNTQVRDLSPLQGSKLRELYLGSYGLADLKGVAGLPLEVLSVYGNKIADLSPLRGMPLRQLSLGNNPITDFSPLAGLPLERLDLNSMELTAIPSLGSIPLRSLNLGGNRISDLRPLAGLALKSLSLPNNPIGDLTPLSGMPLQTLDLGTDQRPVDLAPLAGCKDLEEIILPRYFLHEEVLKTLPKLKRARLNGYQQFYLPMPQFWAELKPEWIAMAHTRTRLHLSGLKLLNSNPVQTEPDGTYFLDLHHADGAPLPALTGLPVTRMSLDYATITDLSPLRGLPLRRLGMFNTPVTDLAPLQGMPLIALVASGSKVTSLLPLRGMRLEVLVINGVKVPAQELSILVEMPLQEVGFAGVKISDFSFLRGKALRWLEIGSTNVTDLSFLGNTPLEYLNISGTPLSDLSPLRGKSIKNLQFSASQVRDLSPLRGLPIVELSMNNVPVQDFTPLLDLPKLEKLRLNGSPSQILPLRRHPTLKFLATSNNGPFYPVEDFWATYDAAQKPAGPK